MKIGISATGNSLESLFDKRFGRCEYFLIYDDERDEFEALKNEGKTSPGGAGIKAVQQLIDAGVDVIITGNLGPNAFELVEKSGIKAYKSKDILLKDVLKNFKENKLEKIETAGPAHQG